MQSSPTPYPSHERERIEPRQALGDLLDLAGSERTATVLELLRELLLMPTPGAGQPALLTLEQVAERVQVHPRTIRRAIDTGEIEAVDLPFRGGLRVRMSALEDWLQRHAAEQRVPLALKARRSGRLEMSDL